MEKMVNMMSGFGNYSFNNNSVWFLVLYFLLSSNLIFAQPNYSMKLSNGVKVNANTIEFDVTIKSTNSSFVLTSYQCSFLFNQSISNGGQLSFTYIEGSSQLSNLPSFAIGINNTDGEAKLTFASMAGSDQITTQKKVVGRFRLQNNVALINADPNIQWNFEGFVSTILTGEFFQNITSPTSHTSNLTLGSGMNNNTLPTEYKLMQNYPNPFNPSTTINFDLANDGQVDLMVFNVLGEMVDKVMSEKLFAGSHSVKFRGDGLPSGTYYCKIQVEDEFAQIIKMVLLK